MGCNCKSKSTVVERDDNEGLFQKVVKNVIKVFGFLVSLILLPLIMGIIIWYMFDMIVLNQNLDLRKILTYFINKSKRFTEDDDDEDDDEDYDDLTEDDVVLLNSDEIIPKSD